MVVFGRAAVDDAPVASAVASLVFVFRNSGHYSDHYPDKRHHRDHGKHGKDITIILTNDYYQLPLTTRNPRSVYANRRWTFLWYPHTSRLYIVYRV